MRSRNWEITSKIDKGMVVKDDLKKMFKRTRKQIFQTGVEQKTPGEYFHEDKKKRIVNISEHIRRRFTLLLESIALRFE